MFFLALFDTSEKECPQEPEFCCLAGFVFWWVFGCNSILESIAGVLRDLVAYSAHGVGNGAELILVYRFPLVSISNIPSSSPRTFFSFIIIYFRSAVYSILHAVNRIIFSKNRVVNLPPFLDYHPVFLVDPSL